MSFKFDIWIFAEVFEKLIVSNSDCLLDTQEDILRSLLIALELCKEFSLNVFKSANSLIFNFVKEKFLFGSFALTLLTFKDLLSLVLFSFVNLFSLAKWGSWLLCSCTFDLILELLLL